MLRQKLFSYSDFLGNIPFIEFWVIKAIPFKTCLFQILSQLQTGHALEIWICGCSLFYKRELWASKSAGAHSTKSLKISGCKRWCPKDLRVRAPAAPILTHSLPEYILILVLSKHWDETAIFTVFHFVAVLQNLSFISLLRLIDLGSPRPLTTGHD